MATIVRSDGEVQAPLNITRAAPGIDLQGFRWDTVDSKINGLIPGRGPLADVPPVHSSQRSFRAQAALPSDGAPAPDALSEQLSSQLEIGKVFADDDPTGMQFPLKQFKGAYAGNGFNTIFRPRASGPNELPKVPTVGPNDNILELNLTLEQLTFGTPLGAIPNRGLFGVPDITLSGLPYLQTIQDVTNTDTGRGDHPKRTAIHFEPGVWLNVPQAKFQTQDSITRMASIPHGTTINAQGLVPTVKTASAGAPDFTAQENIIDTTPFQIGKPTSRIPFASMDEKNPTTFRIPQDLSKFGSGPNGSGLITTEIIKNPNLVLKNAIQGQTIKETITFSVATNPQASQLNGGGTANIAFLQGQQVPITSTDMNTPTAHAATMSAKYWVETVIYDVVVPSKLPPNTTVEISPVMPPGSTAPTPKFKITTPNRLEVSQEPIPIKVPGIQIQSSQLVILNFATLSWPHVSVSTLVPTAAQPFQMP